MPGSGRYAEIYGSPAIAYGRIYFTTEAGLYCLGDQSQPFKVTKDEPVEPAGEEPGRPAPRPPRCSRWSRPRS